MVNTALISVIMPCYNAGSTISESVSSVLQQSYEHLELIIIDDGSEDNSAEVIRSFSDGRIRYIFQQNRGQCNASNAGIALAKGAYIKFLDADDVINKEHLELQISRLKDDHDCIASCEWGRFYDSDFNSAVFQPESVWQDLPSLEWLKMALSQESDMMGAWVWLIPAPILQKAGGWDERLTLNNDFEFSTRLLLQSRKILFAAGAKLYYRSGNVWALSAAKSLKNYEAAFLSTQQGCSYLLKAEDSKEMRRLCANRYRQWMFRIYPDHPDLLKKIEKEISSLGGSNIQPDGGKVFRLLRSVFGWKAAKKIRLFFYKSGYQPK